MTYAIELPKLTLTPDQEAIDRAKIRREMHQQGLFYPSSIDAFMYRNILQSRPGHESEADVENVFPKEDVKAFGYCECYKEKPYVTLAGTLPGETLTRTDELSTARPGEYIYHRWGYFNFTDPKTGKVITTSWAKVVRIEEDGIVLSTFHD